MLVSSGGCSSRGWAWVGVSHQSTKLLARRGHNGGTSRSRTKILIVARGGRKRIGRSRTKALAAIENPTSFGAALAKSRLVYNTIVRSLSLSLYLVKVLDRLGNFLSCSSSRCLLR
jgi:hypothetical protein